MRWLPDALGVDKACVRATGELVETHADAKLLGTGRAGDISAFGAIWQYGGHLSIGVNRAKHLHDIATLSRLQDDHTVVWVGVRIAIDAKGDCAEDEQSNNVRDFHEYPFAVDDEIAYFVCEFDALTSVI